MEDNNTKTEDNNKHYCGDEVTMMKRKTRVRTLSFIRFQSDDPLFIAPNMYKLIMISSRIFFTLLSPMCQVIRTNMTPSYKTINSITKLHVYIWNSSAVIILGGTDRHGHENKFNKEVDNPPSSLSKMPTYSVIHTNIIIYNNQAYHVMPYHATIHLLQLI